MVATEKTKQHLPEYKSSLFVYLLIMIFLLEVTSLSWWTITFQDPSEI